MKTRHFGDDRVSVRIPGRHDLAGFDGIAIADRDHGAVRNLVALTLATELVDHAQFAGARYRDPVTLLVMHGLQVVQTRRALALHFHRVGGSRTRCRTTDVERTHRQLRARFTDRLRSNDADRFTHVDAMTTRQVAAVTLRAHAIAGLAGDRRTDLDLIDAFLLQQLDQLLVDQRAGRQNHDRIVARLHHIVGHHAAEHALAQTFDDIAAFDDRIHHQAIDRAAILLP